MHSCNQHSAIRLKTSRYECNRRIAWTYLTDEKMHVMRWLWYVGIVTLTALHSDGAYDDASAHHGYSLRVNGMTVGGAMNHGGVRDLDVAEIFSGSAGIKHAAEALGLTAAEYDRTTGGEQQDALTSAGWKTLVDVILRVKVKGLVWFGTDCSF